VEPISQEFVLKDFLIELIWLDSDDLSAEAQEDVSFGTVIGTYIKYEVIISQAVKHLAVKTQLTVSVRKNIRIGETPVQVVQVGGAQTVIQTEATECSRRAGRQRGVV
jgi:hypothetical protein